MDAITGNNSSPGPDVARMLTNAESLGPDVVRMLTNAEFGTLHSGGLTMLISIYSPCRLARPPELL